MAVDYLSSGDLTAMGLSGAAAADVTAASRMVDGYLARPEGVVWLPDADGLPAYMAGLAPRLTLALGGAIAPGSAVSATVAGAALLSVGDVLIADRADGTKREALTVTAISGATVTFDTVAHAHSSAATLDLGLVIEETAHPNLAGMIRPSRTPTMRVLGASYWDAYGAQRIAQIAANGLNIVQVSALLPTTGAMLDIGYVGGNRRGIADQRRFPDTLVRYVAGYPSTAIPDPVKQATAAILRGLQQFPELVGNVKALTAGGTTIERFAPGLIDGDTATRLAPYAASTVFF